MKDEYFRSLTAFSAKWQGLFRNKTEKDMPDSVFSMEHGSVVDTSLAAQILQRFVADANINVACEKIKISLTRSEANSQQRVLARICGLLTNSRTVVPTLNEGFVFVTGEIEKTPVLVFVQFGTQNNRYREFASGNDEDDDTGVLHLSIDIYSELKCCLAIRSAIEATYGNEKLAHIKWWFEGQHGAAQQSLYLSKPSTTLHAEFYPDLGDPHQFIDAYMKSDASVLLMAGAPGTGKTTLLRHMIAERNLVAHVIYDENLMQRDSIFQSFLFDRDSDVMVIEDADTILLPRENDGNKIMSRFLNVSDGLIKLPNKKLIFTTNISDFNKVDQALLRPGRCYGIVHTRPLNLTEAQAAAKVANLPIPAEKGEYSLAELFNQGYRPRARQVGFTA